MFFLAAVVLVQSASATDLDFWIGDWECVGRSLSSDGKSWTETRATNRIAKAFDGKVVRESFQMGSFVGESWSVFEPKSSRWQQTWVDNQGSYIALAGGRVAKEFVLTTLPKPKAPKLFNRMVFSKVTPSSFTWSWEKSTDGGKQWQLQWELKYTRKPKG